MAEITKSFKALSQKALQDAREKRVYTQLIKNQNMRYDRVWRDSMKKMIRIEIYEGDPFGGACCGPGPLVSSVSAVERLRRMLEERNQTVKKLSEEYKDKITIKREIISPKRWDYPAHVIRMLHEGKPKPYIFINEEPVSIGKFPSYEEFTALLKVPLQREQCSNG